MYKVLTCCRKIVSFISLYLFFSLKNVFAADDDPEEFTFDEQENLSLDNELTNVFLNFNLPDNTNLLMLFLSVIIAVAFGVLLYRALLKSQVTQGVHPREFLATIIFALSGFFLLSMFFILIQTTQAALGWFTIFSGIYLILLLIFIFIGHLRKWLFVILILIVAIIGFRLSNMDMF